jgi:hypothetical protein
MSRFEEMLLVLLPSMHIHWKLKPMISRGVRERFAAWKQQQQTLAPSLDALSFLDQVPDEQSVWRLDEAEFLYRDRYLRITSTFDGYLPTRVKYAFRSIQSAIDDNWFRYDLISQTREELATRLSQPETRMALFTMHMSHLLRIYQKEPDDGSPLFYASKRLYMLTTAFFGQGFRPLMQVLKLHLSGERELVLHPFNTERGGFVVAASEVDRLVGEHLGLVRFTCRQGKKAVRQDEHYSALLETYTMADRAQVAGYLAAQHRTMRAIGVRLLLCELALRKVIPSGVYVVQAE